MTGEALQRHDALRARSRSFQALLNRTYETFQDALQQAANPYIALSGGKDSLVAATLTADLRPRTPAIWIDNEHEWTETPVAVREQAAHLGLPLTIKTGSPVPNQHGRDWILPWRNKPFWREWEPDTVVDWQYSYDFAKAQGFDGAILGLRATEAHYRRMNAITRGTVYDHSNGLIHFQPLAWWDVDAIWAFIAQRELPYHPVYDAFARARVPRKDQRIGTFTAADRWLLQAVDPTLPARLEARYGKHW